MRPLFILGLILSMMTISSCSILQKSKKIEKEKVEISDFQETKINFRSESSNYEVSEIVSENQLIGLLSAINWQYQGKDSAEIEIIQTSSGIKIKTKGSGTANLDTESNFKSESSKSEISHNTEIEQKTDVHLEENSLVKIDKSKIDKSKDVKRTDFSAWIWIVVLVVIIFSLAMYWLFGKPNKSRTRNNNINRGFY